MPNKIKVNMPKPETHLKQSVRLEQNDYYSRKYESRNRIWPLVSLFSVGCAVLVFWIFLLKTFHVI